MDSQEPSLPYFEEVHQDIFILFGPLFADSFNILKILLGWIAWGLKDYLRLLYFYDILSLLQLGDFFLDSPWRSGKIYKK